MSLSPAGENGGAGPAQRGGAGLACLYLLAFWSQFKPSEPFLVDYFVEVKGLSNREVYQSVFSLFVYARLPFVALVGLLSELPCCGCRGVLVAGAACGLATVLLTRFGATIAAQQAAQFTVAAAFASRIAVPALAFLLTTPSQFQQSIHTVKAVMLFSNFCSAVVGELLRDFARVPLSLLFEISAVGQALSLVFALLLPDRRQDPAVPAASLGKEPKAEADLARGAGATRRALFGGGELSSSLRAPARDLYLSLGLRGVMWWTAWALAMNPVHGLALTYWQSLVRAKRITDDHNGYLLASMYLVASALTAVSGRTKPFKGLTSVLVIGSMLGASLLLCRLVSESRQMPVYGCLLVYQCLFEVTTAVATFQVGAEVTTATGASTSRALHAAAPARAGGERRPMPGTARLTLLFSVTAIAAGANENVMQLVVNGWRSMESRFLGLGVCLAAFGLLLGLVRAAEALLACHQRPAAEQREARCTSPRTTSRVSAGGARPQSVWSSPAADLRSPPPPLHAGAPGQGALAPLLLHDGCAAPQLS